MNWNIVATAFVSSALGLSLYGGDFDLHREVEKANKQTLPFTAKLIEGSTDAKLTIEVDAESFGTDEKAWGNLYIIANRIAGAFSEVGRDQVGKDAIERDVKRVVIVKLPEGREDAVELKDHTVFVRSNASDQAMIVLQNIIIAALEKALQTGHPPTP